MNEIVVCGGTNVAGSFSESHETRLSEPLACGRSGQSREKADVLLRFAERICDGVARPDEVAFMLAMMAQDMPA